jgi:hypothetical protein
MPQDIKRSLYDDLGLESAGVKFDDFVKKFDNDPNVRKSIHADLGLDKAGVSFDAFEEKVGKKKIIGETIPVGGQPSKNGISPTSQYKLPSSQPISNKNVVGQEWALNNEPYTTPIPKQQMDKEGNYQFNYGGKDYTLGHDNKLYQDVNGKKTLVKDYSNSVKGDYFEVFPNSGIVFSEPFGLEYDPKFVKEHGSGLNPEVNVKGFKQETKGDESIHDFYNIKSYATAPHHEKVVDSAYKTILKIPTLSAESINDYMKKNSGADKVPFSGEDIINVANKYNVDPAAIMAIIQVDSSFGTKGKAVRTKNAGNVGNTDSGASKYFKTWKEGLDAVGKQLAKRKIKDNTAISKIGGESTPQLPLTSQSRLGEKPKLNPFTATPEELKAAYPTPIDNKRASLKMYNDANKLTIDRINKKQKIKDLNAEMENISAQIPQIEAIYKDELKPYEVRKQAETELKDLYAKGQQIQNEGKPLIDDINNSAKETIGLLKGGRELNTQANYDLSEQNTGFLEYLGGNIANGAVSMGESVVRILPYLQGGIVPEAAKYESRQIADKMHKYGEELANFGLDPNLEKLFTTKGWNNPKKYGYILGKAIGQSIPAAGVGLATGGSGTAVALVGGLQGFSETYNILSENKGLTEQQKMLLSTGAAIPLGLLEEYGMGDVLKLMTGSSLKKEVAKNLLKENATLGAKNLTKEELFQVGVKTFGETLKEFAPKLLKASNKEGFTEVLQSETNEGIKQIGEAISGEDSNKDQTKTQYVIDNLKSGLEDYGFGAIGGTSLGSIGSYHEAKYNKPIYEQAILLKDPKAFEDFNELLQSEIQNGNLTQEEAAKSLNVIKSIQEADVLIPQTIKDNTKRGYAVNLVSEKKDLEEQIANSDKSLTTDLQDRVDAINSELEKIGNNENTFGLLEYNVGELEDNKYYTFLVKSESEIPEQYRDRVKKLADIETKKTVLGIPYGKSEKQKVYSYTLTGKELKQIYEQDNNTEDDLSETQAPQEITTEPTSTEGVEAISVEEQQAIDEAIPNLAEPLKKEIKGLTTIENLMSEGVLEYVDEQTGEPCMKHGIKGNSFKRGSKWEIVKDLKGYKTHEQGGVDLTIGSDGIKIKNGKTDYYAKNGLLMPNN